MYTPEVISRRRVVAGIASLFLINTVGGVQGAAALPQKKKRTAGKKHVSHAATVTEPSIPSTLDPAVLAAPTKQIVFYAPHPDDELLSFGAIASEYISLGYEVTYVLLSSGSTSTAIKLINGELNSPGNGTRFVYRGTHNPAIAGYKPLTVEDIGSARVTEFKSSAGEMSVSPDHLFIYDLLKENELHLEDVTQVISTIAEIYPMAIHWTMSTVDIHPHHRVVGEALRTIAEQRQLQTAFTFSRTTWDVLASVREQGNTTIPNTFLFKPSADRVQRIRNAALPYNAWNPQAGSFAVGYASVPKQFEELDSKSDAQYALTTPPLDGVTAWIPSI